MKKTRSVTAKYFLFVAGCFLIIILTSILEIALNSKVFLSNNILDENWTININDKLYTHAKLSSINFNSAKRGDIITIKNTIPETSITYPVIWFNTLQCAVKVESGDTILYKYGLENFLHKKIVGSGSHQIPLQDLSKNRDITITFYIAEDNLISSLPIISIDNASNVYATFLKLHPFTFAGSVFLLFLGAIGTIICSVSLFMQKRIYSLLAISQFSFWSGLLVFCNNGFVQFISSNFVLNTWIEYISLYFCPISLASVFYCALSKTDKERMHIKIFCAVHFVFCITSICLQIFTNIHFMTTLPIWNVIIIISIIYAIFSCIKEILNNKHKVSITATGFLMMTLICGLDLIRYLLYKFNILVSPFTQTSQIALGAIIFIISSLISYFSWLYNYSQEVVIPEIDPITGLATRNKCLSTLKSFDRTQIDYAVISLSIEIVNKDKNNIDIEHRELLLRRYARLVKRVFGIYGLCGRLDLSRFIVVTPELPESKLKQLLFIFTKLINKENTKNPSRKIISHQGYAYNTSLELVNGIDVCKIADKMINKQVDDPILLSISDTEQKALSS